MTFFTISLFLLLIYYTIRTIILLGVVWDLGTIIHSRYIAGWNLSETLDTSSVMQAVKEAVETYGKPEILNSDQGCQFTSNEYKNMLKDLEITQSMDGKSRWADNIMIERWFRSLKVENIYTNEYLTPRSLRQGISAYIEQYNTVRPHEALDYKTPAKVYFEGAEELGTAC